jgi:ATP/maltotriose-dependent transcriptional regulator MalT
MSGVPQFDPSIGQKHIIERPRLLKLLDETEAKIILLVAPAGYGKTTLARQWLRTRRKPRLWVRGRDALSGVGLAAAISEAVAAECDAVGGRLRQRMRAVARPWIPQALRFSWLMT